MLRAAEAEGRFEQTFQQLNASARTLDGDPAAAPTISMRQVDRTVADLKLALAPLTATRLLRRRPALERPVSALLDCVHWARIVAAEASAPHDPADRPRLLAAAARLDALSRGETPVPVPAPSTEIADPLAQLERAITTMEERSTLGTFETYALDS